MKMFMLKSIGIAALMFISVLAGMQMANGGIHKMKGYNDLQDAISIKEKDDKVNKSFSGKNPAAHDLKAKQKKLEEISSFNIFSMLGKKLSDGISGASEELVNRITK
ncbi:MAG: DUF3679 domain-containing protein [Neobacillus sp.]